MSLPVKCFQVDDLQVRTYSILPRQPQASLFLDLNSAESSNT